MKLFILDTPTKDMVGNLAILLMVGTCQTSD